MLKIHERFVSDVENAASAEHLHPLIQAAIELEHATIPPYLAAFFSIKLGCNRAAAEIIRSVVVEEMLHLTIASNLLVAVGGAPAINTPHFVPDYPGGLPLGIGDHLQIHLRKCSIAQIRDVFMAIEEPEHPIDIPAAAAAPKFETIGAFYKALANKIDDLGPSIFRGDPRRQVIARRWFPDENELFLIDGPKSARRAIEVIVDQGEGTTTAPFDHEGLPAHYYRFEEIVKGRRLIEVGGKPAFAGEAVPFDADGVWNMDDDPKAAKYREGSRSRLLVDQFDASYTRLLNALHDAFNGAPGRIDAAMGVMYELRLLAQQVLATPAEWADGTPNPNGATMTGLCFEYRP